MSLSYYDVGTRDNIVISNSSLTTLDPTTGGSIIKFMDFFSEEEEKKSKLSLENGKLIHKYAEDKDAFAIEDEDKPTEMMSGLLEKVIELKHNLSLNPLTDVDITITSNIKTEKAAQAEIAEITFNYGKLSEILQLSVEDTIRVFRQARITKNAYTSYTENKLVSNVISDKSIKKYLDFLVSASTKIILTPSAKKAVEGAIQSIYSNTKVAYQLDLRKDDLEELSGAITWITYKEVAVYWQENVPVPNTTEKYKVLCKALLDNLRVDHTKKLIKYTDLKSTGKSIYQYQSSFEYYRTYRQIAFYDRAIKFWFEAMFPDKDFREYTVEHYIVPVETFGRFLSTIYKVSVKWIYKGREEYRSLLMRYAWHAYHGEYNLSMEEALNNGILTFKDPVE